MKKHQLVQHEGETQATSATCKQHTTLLFLQTLQNATKNSTRCWKCWKHDTLFPRFLVLFWLVVRLGRKMWKFREDFWILEYVEEEGKRMLLCFIFFFWFWKNPRKSKGGGKYILWDFYISIRWKDFRVFLLRIMPVGKRGFSLKNYGRRIFIGSFHFQWTML